MEIPGYSELASDHGFNNFDEAFTYVTNAAINTNGRISFSLNGVDIEFASEIKSGIGLYEQLPEYGGKSLWESEKITEWELSRIAKDKKLSRNSDFYLDNRKLNAKEVKELLKKFTNK